MTLAELPSDAVCPECDEELWMGHDPECSGTLAPPEGRSCPATREAVDEHEEAGGNGCPICGAPSDAHRSET